jgi:hypothetical protein
MTGHISDRTLDHLLDGSLDHEDELAIEDHAHRCSRCATRLREWQILFPQIKSLIPTSEHPVYAGTAPSDDQPSFIPTPRPASLDVLVPDWSPPESPNRFTISPVRAMWGLVILLAVGAAYLLLRRTESDSMDTAFQPVDLEPAPTVVDSSGLGSGIPSPEESARLREQIAQQIRDSLAAIAAKSQVPETPTSTSIPTSTVSPSRGDQPVATADREAENRPVASREEPVRFPIRADESRPATSNPATAAPQPEQTAPSGAPASPDRPALPAEFTRVSLGEAIGALSGTVRLIQGMTPETVEVAQGTILPGADPKRAVVRIVYNSSEGRIILDQQRLDRSQGGEPSIAISTTPSGVSVAQWVDRGGFWISLAGRTDQTNLLSIANRVR